MSIHPMIAMSLVAVGSQQPFTEHEFKGRYVQPASFKYVVSLPEGYDADKKQKWPVLLFLHGAGERGEDLQKLYIHGPLKEIKNGRKVPFIVVAPQCPDGRWWDINGLIALLNNIERNYRVDKDRELLSGLSMGGFGSWALASAQPNRFAAIAPICGGGVAFTTWEYAKVPIWVRHGDADPIVPFDESKRMVDGLIHNGGKPRFDIVPGGGHDVWTDLYASDEFWSWLAAQKREGKN